MSANTAGRDLFQRVADYVRYHCAWIGELFSEPHLFRFDALRPPKTGRAVLPFPCTAIEADGGLLILRLEADQLVWLLAHPSAAGIGQAAKRKEKRWKQGAQRRDEIQITFGRGALAKSGVYEPEPGLGVLLKGGALLQTLPAKS